MWVCLLVIFLFSLLGGALLLMRKQQRVLADVDQQIPLIFVPGSSATQERFNATIRKIQRQMGPHSVLKVTVSKDGQLQTSGQWAVRDPHPFVVVAFADNRDLYQVIQQQADWLVQALSTLQETYHFQQFQAVGHSNGGLNWIYYLERHHDEERCQMLDLVTIGSPYNLSEKNKQRQTQLLQDLIAGRSQLPRQLRLINLAGQRDKIVPISSVEAGNLIFQKQLKQYQYRLIKGRNTGHSHLPINRQVLAIICAMLEDKPTD